MTYEVEINGTTRTLEVQRHAADAGWSITIDGRTVGADVAAAGAHTCSLLIDGRSFTFHSDFAGTTPAGTRLWIAGPGGRETFATVRNPRRLTALRPLEMTGPARLLAPMAGKVVRLLAAAGDLIEAGQGVVVLEAMKMQNEVRSPKTGTLRTLAVAPGTTVAAGTLLAEIG